MSGSVASMFESAVANIIFPDTTSEVAVFYFFWIVAYVAINVVWDIRSVRTPKFHISRMKDKNPVLFNAATFASSLLILISLIEPKMRTVAGDTVVPIILAGLSGVLQSLASICPHPPTDTV